MNRKLLVAAACATFVVATPPTRGQQAQSQLTAAQPASGCEATRSHYRERLDRKIMPTWLKSQYEGAVRAAYQSCLKNQASAWDRVERMLG